MIEAEGLTKFYGRVPAIKNVSFRIDRGEIAGLLGPNGAGKTTVMRILAGFLPPSRGSARVAGRDLAPDSLEARRRIGYLPETVPLYQEMTVRSYLKFFAAIRGLTGRRRESQADKVMGLCRIDKHAGTRIGNLSKGYRQLVGVAQAIVHDPEVLILDEPTLGIDPRQVVQIRRLIMELGRERTVILSSHILPEVSMVCEKVIIMDRGRVVASDLAENLSSLIEGNQRFEIQAEGPAEEVASRLRSVTGVLKVTVEGSVRTGHYMVECAPGRDLRDELAAAVVEGGLRLLGLRSHEMSLEDVFLRLTTSEPEEDLA